MAESTQRLVRILSRQDVRDVLQMPECIDTIQSAFQQQGVGRAIPSSVTGTYVEGGGFHIKAAGLIGEPRERPVFAAKVNANFPANPVRNGLPTVQGVIALFDAAVGQPLAVLDSIEITSARTAAASAVAARHLAREGAVSVTVCGCGEQGRSHLRALRCVRSIRRVTAFDIDFGNAERYAAEMGVELGVEVIPVRELGGITRESDVWVTCTPSPRWFVGRDHVAPGTFIAAVGADNHRKQEIAPELMAASTVVVDVLDQCAAMGDLHHVLELGLMTRDDVHAELADVVAGRRPGRRTADEIIVFDSTGTALEDVATAKLVYERAVAMGIGVEIDLSSAGQVPNVSHAHAND